MESFCDYAHSVGSCMLVHCTHKGVTVAASLLVSEQWLLHCGPFQHPA